MFHTWDSLFWISPNPKLFKGETIVTLKEANGETNYPVDTLD